MAERTEPAFAAPGFGRIRLNLRSVRARTTLGAALALSVLVAVSGLAIERLVARQVRAAADVTLLEQANDRAQLLAAGAPATSLVNVIGDEVLAVVLGPDGAVLAAAGTTTPGELASLDDGLHTVDIVVTEAGDGDDDDNDHDDDHDQQEEPHRERIRTAVATASTGARVVVGNEGEATREAINAVRGILAVGAPLVAAVGALVAWLVTGRALAPVHRLRNDLESVTGHGGRVHVPATADEIESLAATVNEVLGALEVQSVARRRFVADASHELKSPIANAKVLVDTAGADAEPGLSHAIGAELDRLQSLVDDLLFLARTDETAPPTPAPFDLDDVLFDEAERAMLRTPATIDAAGVVPARVRADRAEVARAVRNLVENAARHAASIVHISVERVERVGPEDADHWAVVVTDDGSGVAAEDRERIFQRFTRLDGDRARSAGGTGLGLSIVASIATRNGGLVSVDDAPSGGARFRLVLPAAS